MKSLLLFAAVIFGCAMSAPAFAFHPADETYGYVPPKKFDRKHGAEAKAEDSQPLFGMGWDWSSPQKKKNEQDEDQQADNKQSLTGGGQPHISAKAPPKVSFRSGYAPGSVIIDTADRRLYYVLTSSTAYSYPIAVGKEGFAWTGTEKISKKVAWPDWIPPAEMRARKPGLPERMSGGVRNPLGAMALYLGNTLYRIHGTNDASSIGTAASSGCIRMTNANVVHLASLADIGTTVYVLKRLPANVARLADRDG
ncbi:MAG: L,D-transpeptidase [Hyphomicrobium sp.]|uniref:L,D-transpeptidase n=1 Tax=Hyphomicrobium sp. TaxID=82 RepID=UPI0039E70004